MAGKDDFSVTAEHRGRTQTPAPGRRQVGTMLSGLLMALLAPAALTHPLQ